MTLLTLDTYDSQQISKKTWQMFVSFQNFLYFCTMISLN